MLDIDIRTALDLVLREQYPSALVRHEMKFYDRKRYAGMVLIGEEFCAFEIKSDGDTLRRFPQQVTAYGHVFDRVTLVTGEKYRDTSSHTTPGWWGHMLAKNAQRGYLLRPLEWRNRIPESTLLS